MRTVRPRLSSLLALALAIFAAACGDNQPSSAKAITSFAFLAAQNPQLSSDVVAAIAGDRISATLPYGTDPSALVATFATTGGEIYVDQAAQKSGVTANNFSQSIEYIVSAADHSTMTYTATVHVAISSAKALTAFSFLAANNPGLSNDVIATISGDAIGAIVPYGTDITALKPTFVTTGAQVAIGNTVQTSGHTSDNFMQAIDVVVTAADGSTTTYAMAVSVAASSAKQMLLFELSSALNNGAGISTNEMATISGNTIAIGVPYGTDISALVPTFMSNGATVTINGVVQVSGMTPVDFTKPVTYVVTAADGTVETFTVVITIANSPAKAITAFELTSAANSGAGVTSDVVATVSGFQIGATVPFGTDMTALVATFATTGARVAVGGTTQISGTTANDFASPVTYVVTAADGTTQSYVVTVTMAMSSAKALTGFEFAAAANGLTSDAVGAISGSNVDVTVPYGTDPSALVATFTTTGNSVAIDGTPQASGVTNNDFSSSVDYTVTAQDGSSSVYHVIVTVAKNPAKAITSFELTSALNSGAGVSSDAVGTIGADFSIALTVPYGTNVSSLIATFATTGAGVQVARLDQVSGATSNDFTNEVDYVVTAADGTTQTYVVTVTVALNPAKDITAFELTSALDSGAGVSADAIGTINGTNIQVYVPYNTTVTALIATFTTDGASVAVAGTQQQSGVTANDFTSAVSYVVTAADGTQQTYTVSVVALSFATAWLSMPNYDDWENETEVPGTKQLVFLYAPAGTQLNSDADYKAYCESFGFEQNQNDASYYQTDSAGMYSATDYYCIDACCYLGAGNDGAQYISDFQNIGLPANTPLQVFDRGCGDTFGDYATSLNTTDLLSVTSATSFSYTDNQNDGQSKTTTFAQAGVVVCETR